MDLVPLPDSPIQQVLCLEVHFLEDGVIENKLSLFCSLGEPRGLSSFFASKYSPLQPLF